MELPQVLIGQLTFNITFFPRIIYAQKNLLSMVTRLFLNPVVFGLTLLLTTNIAFSASEGKRLFEARWVVPFLGSGLWGKGPHSNAGSCIDCHQLGTNIIDHNNKDDGPSATILKLRLISDKGHDPHPIYGNELSSVGVIGKLTEEGTFEIEWSKEPSNQHPKPKAKITSLWFGELGNETARSLRMGRTMNILGALEKITERQLIPIILEQRNKGLNGRINYVINTSSSDVEIGRFGYKASSPSLEDQISKALRDEIGVTSFNYPNQPCAASKIICEELNEIKTPEISNKRIRLISDFLRVSSPQVVPNGDKQFDLGKNIFESTGCSLCHRTDLHVNLVSKEGTESIIYPYTDLLIHDMGEGLEDGFTEGLAGPRDWRTAPLTGIGDHLSSGGSLIHDGRAQNLKEAILWHGGEASKSREKYLLLKSNEKTALENFVKDL